MTRGIDLAVPQLERSLLRKADQVTWVANYDDGTSYAQAEGGLYQLIDRSRLTSFQFVHGGDILFTTFPPPGATGHNLCFRRRTAFGGSEREVWFLIAWVPMGPVAAFNPQNGLCRTAWQFDPSENEIAPPDMPHPGETFTLGDIAALS